MMKDYLIEQQSHSRVDIETILNILQRKICTVSIDTFSKTV